jgi:ferredoxin
VDQDRCQGHNLCAIVAATVFLLDEEDGHARAVPGAVPPALERWVAQAVKSCPEEAIVVTDD